MAADVEPRLAKAEHPAKPLREDKGGLDKFFCVSQIHGEINHGYTGLATQANINMLYQRLIPIT